MAERKIKLILGGYGKENEQAICFAEFDPENSSLRKISGIEGLSAPTYLAILKKGEDRILYTFERSGQGGAVVALLLTEEGNRELSRFRADWIGPCHISVSEKEDLVFCASYGKGNIAVFRILEDGGLRFFSKVQHEGHGARPDRQAVPHCHFAGDRDGRLYAADLGLDKVFIYGIDREKETLIPTGQNIEFPAGSGPRHLIMAGEKRERLYVLTEMSSEVFAWRKTEAGWEFLDRADALPGIDPSEELCVPASADVLSVGSAIKMSADEKYLFVSLRLGYQAITAFRVEEDGRLTYLHTAGTGGITPRDFGVFGDDLIVANKDSDLVTVLHFDRQTEKLALTDIKMEMVQPTCVVALPE